MDADARAIEALFGAVPDHVRTRATHDVVAESRPESGLRRIDLLYDVDTPREVPATILLPDEIRHATGILALHQTTEPHAIGREETVTSTRGRADLHYGLELARRGFAVIAPDYPLFGAYMPDVASVYDRDGYAAMSTKGVANHIVAANVLQAVTGGAVTRFAAIGHSLGGSNSLFVGIFDPRIVASVSSAGFSSFEHYARHAPEGDLSGWARRDKYLPRIAERFGNDWRQLPCEFDTLLAAHGTGNLFLNVPLRDDVFPFAGTETIVARARARLAAAGKTGEIVMRSPDAGHDFPDAVRAEAYAFIERIASAQERPA